MVLQRLGYVFRGERDGQRGQEIQALGLWAGTLHSNYNPQTGLSLRLWLPEQAEVGWQRAAALWKLFGTATWDPGLMDAPHSQGVFQFSSVQSLSRLRLFVTP